jgi:hypothetical protein
LTELARRYGLAVVFLVLVVLAVELVPSARTRLVKPSSTDAGSRPYLPFGEPGTTAGGYACGPGKRQVPWSKYAPLCEPKWHGDNGGATSPGVTATNIYVTYRMVASTEMAELYDILPRATIGTDAQVVQDLNAYIALFNKTFELYGRKVVLVPFEGQSDFVAEFEGGDMSQAEQDAATAKNNHAFADVSIIDSTPIYDQALAQQGIISLSPFGGPASQFDQYSPYEYSTASPLCQKGDLATAEVVGRVLAGSPVSFSGDPSMNGKKRVFGIIEDSDPVSEECTGYLTKLLASYGIRPAVTVGVALDANRLVQESGTVIAQLRAAGVTTVLTTTLDFLTPIFITSAADSAGYVPEWFNVDNLDGFTRKQDPREAAHSIALGLQPPPEQDTEAYEAFKLEDPGIAISPANRYIYDSVLTLFDSLEEAGPDLTPKTFQEGFRSIPDSMPGGMYGDWKLTPGAFDPLGTYQIVWWDSKSASNEDGEPGAWVACNKGAQYSEIQGVEPSISKGTTLSCFGPSGRPPT